MQKPLPSVRSQFFSLLIGLVFVLICVLVVGLSFFLNNIENAIYQSSLKPIPTGTPDDPAPNATVTCNGVPMSPHDLCTHTFVYNGHPGLPTDFTYEQQKQYQKQLRLDAVVAQREKLALQQHQQPRPFGGVLGCLSFPLFFVGVSAGIVALGMLVQEVRQLFKRRQI